MMVWGREDNGAQTRGDGTMAMALEIRLQHFAEEAVTCGVDPEELVGPDGLTERELDEIAEATGLAAKLATQKRIGLALQLSDIKRLMRLIGVEV
jgi:hypothetical protein